MKKQQNNFSLPANKKLVGGLVAGALIGATAAFLMSKSGKEFTNSLSGSSESVSSKLKDINWSNLNEETSNSKKWLLLAGGILGISTALLVSNSCGKTVCKGMAHTFDSLNKKTRILGEVGTKLVWRPTRQC
jgi:gas vesicle protein